LSIRFAVLAVLSEQPLHGYAIRAALEQRCAELCEPDDGEVYRALASLRRDGLVEPIATAAGERRPRKVYAVTGGGRRALRDWVLAVPASAPRARDELPLRLLLAERCSAELPALVVERHAQRGRTDLAELLGLRAAQRAPASFAALVRALRVESAIRLTRASLDALELWRTTLARHGAEAATANEVTREAPAARVSRPPARGKRGG